MADTNGRLARFLWISGASIVVVFGIIGLGVGLMLGRVCL